MAISATHYRILKELKASGVLPQGGRILEIGMANWYGDADSGEFAPGESDLFAIVRKLYDWLMAPTSVDSIDMDPAAISRGAVAADLNYPLVTGRYHTVINHGTAEHIFNVDNVFCVMHDACEVGGLMIHESPFTGWVDHGFWNINPTVFYDLAAANGYEVVGVWLEHLKSQTTIAVECREHIHHLRRSEQLPDDAMLFVVMRKSTDELFRVPMQGVYAGTVSEETQLAWRDLR